MNNSTTTSANAEEKKMTANENAANHKKIASHLQEASKSHIEAAKHHEDGNHEKAAYSTMTAQGHIANAKAASKQDVRDHAITGKI